MSQFVKNALKKHDFVRLLPLDYVSEDIASVKSLHGDGGFGKGCMPSIADEYERWISVNIELMKKRNLRISEYVKENTDFMFSMGNLIGRIIARTDFRMINEMPWDNVSLILSGIKHELIVNRDLKQHNVTDDGECIRMFNTIVNSYLDDLDFDRV